MRSTNKKNPRIVKKRREQIAINARETIAAFKSGNVKRGTLEQLKADFTR